MEKNKIGFLIKLKNKVFRLLFPISGKQFRVSLLRGMGVKVGKDVVITAHTKISCKFGYENLLTIEDRAAVGCDHIILTSDPSNSNLLHLKDKYPFIEVYGKTTIKHDSWLGAGSILLPGVTIGEYSVIAAGSVVTKDVDPYTVVAGIPAKPIKKIIPE